MKKRILRIGRDQKKMFALMDHIVRTDFFVNYLKKFRLQYNIPKEGFPWKGPDKTDTPKKWDMKYEHADFSEVNTFIDNLCLRYGIDPLVYHHYIWSYLLFNNYIYPPAWCFDFHLCTVTQYDKDKFFPVNINISPYATLKDIIDFVMNCYEIIQDFQKPYKKKDVLIGKLRMRNREKMKLYDYIFENKNQKLKNIESQMSDIGGNYDQGTIGKIISLETKRRKKV